MKICGLSISGSIAVLDVNRSANGKVSPEISPFQHSWIMPEPSENRVDVLQSINMFNIIKEDAVRRLERFHKGSNRTCICPTHASYPRFDVGKARSSGSRACPRKVIIRRG
jgi:hypothetical protein